MDSRFSLKIDLAGIADGLGNVRKRKDKDDSRSLVVSKWKYGMPLIEMEKTSGGALGRRWGEEE